MTEKTKEYSLTEFYAMFPAAQMRLSEKFHRNGNLGPQEKAKACTLSK